MGDHMQTELAQIADEMRQITGDRGVCVAAVGSRVTCDPAPVDTDQDFLVLVSQHFFRSGGASALEGAGFKLDNPSQHYLPECSAFNSWRRGHVNLIVTASYDFHRRFLAATQIAKRLNLMHKPDRVALFQAVLYGDVQAFCGFELLGA